LVEALRDAGPLDDAERIEFGRRHLAMLAARHKTLAQQVRDLGGVIHADLMRLTNALQVRIEEDRLGRLARLPGVARIDRVPYYERSLATAVPFVGANQLWNAPGIAATGKGIRVGIIDTGIDYTHADFGGSGDPQAYADNDRSIVEPGTFPTAKVVGGYDFAGDAYSGDNDPEPDDDPLDCAVEQENYIAGGHGTHVAGISAGMGVNVDGTTYAGTYEASLDLSTFKVSPGMAPEASLYALKVFGCEGGTLLSSSALEWAVDPDGDGDLSDRLDIVNMSLGVSYAQESQTDRQLVRNATNAGVLVVVAAGNDSNQFFITGSPSTITEALSVAAVQDQVSFLGLTVQSPPSVAGVLPCAEGAFTIQLSETGPITGVLAAAQPADACADLTNPSELAGKIALINRQTCYFADKLERAANAGAIAAVVVNNIGEPPFSMGGVGTQSAIPGVMVSKADGDALRAALGEGVTVTLDANNVLQSSDNADQMANFSSRGPRSTDGMLKPDVSAPGVAIDSAGVASGTQTRQMGGTSMACPMVAGAAALLREAHPTRTPLQIKAMLMNSTAPMTDGNGNLTPVSLAGAGRIRVDSAAARDVIVSAAQPDGGVSVSFGSVVTFEPASKSKDVVVTNLGGVDKTFELSIAPTAPLAGTEVTVLPSSITVPAGEETTVTVTLDVNPAELPLEEPDPFTPSHLTMWGGETYARHFTTEVGGHVVLSESGSDPSTSLRLPYHAMVRAADRRAAQPARSCTNEANAPIQIAMGGETAHREPLTSAFQLGTTKSPGLSGTVKNLLAVGAATNFATAASFEQATVYFAVAVAGDWVTPSQGQMSSVGIFIDSDLDGSEDYFVFTDAFGDLLVVGTLNLTTQQALGYSYLNAVPRDGLNTEAFNNSVVVLPASLGDLGLTEDAAAFRYMAVTLKIDPNEGYITVPDNTEWVDYNPTQLAIDTAVGGFDPEDPEEPGIRLPFYRADEPVSVILHPDNYEGAPPNVLLLHHTNERGLRMETVDLAAFEQVDPTDLTVEQSLPQSVEGGDSTSVTWTVTNAGTSTAYGVALSATIENAASVGTIASTVGTCEGGESVTCTLGDLEPGASATVEVNVVADQLDIDVTVSVQDNLSCETDESNNAAMGTVAVIPTSGADGGLPDAAAPSSPALSADQFVPGGGCTCGVTDASSNGAAGLAALLGLGMAGFALRRRR